MTLPTPSGFQFKASPFPAASASFGDSGTEGVQPDVDEVVEQHEWAGDLFEEGTESDPASAYARFNGGGGEEAWLDRAEDGTLTAWVRDTDGSVYRYADVDAWAVDTDEAQMARVDPGVDPAGEEGDLEGEEGAEEDLADDEDLEGDLDATEDEELPEEALEDAEGSPVEEALDVEADVAAVEEDLADELAETGATTEDLTDAAVDVAEATVPAEGEEDPEGEEEEDDEDWLAKLEGKSLRSVSPTHQWSLHVVED